MVHALDAGRDNVNLPGVHNASNGTDKNRDGSNVVTGREPAAEGEANSVPSRKRSKLSNLFKVPCTPTRGVTTVSNSATQTPTRSGSPVRNNSSSRVKSTSEPSSSVLGKDSAPPVKRSITEQQIWKTKQDIEKMETFVAENQVFFSPN